MNKVMILWEAPRHLANKSNDARLLSFINWTRHFGPKPASLSAAGFFCTGKKNKPFFAIILVMYMTIIFWVLLD